MATRAAGGASGFEVIPQRGDGLGERLAAAFDDVSPPALLVGMDTPQLTPRLLLDGMRALAEHGVDAVLGPADRRRLLERGVQRARARAPSTTYR